MGNIDFWCQLSILLFTIPGSYMITSNRSWGKWGYLVLLVGEVPWIITAWRHWQWGIVINTLWFGYIWFRGCKNFIWKKGDKS